ncbi:MAG: hypothetical protein AABX65_02840 [Nanoarchaeota archaeon]
MYLRGKRGQVTLFVIIAIIILAAIAIIAFSYPKIKPLISRTTPQVEIESCVQKAVADAVAKLGSSGFTPKIENTFPYQGNNLPYLCYTSENYKTCTAQVGVLKTEAETALAEAIKPAVSKCHAQARVASRNTQVEEKPFALSITPNNIEVKLNSVFTLTQGDAKQTVSGLNVKVASGVYNLLFIAQDIINLEARYGDAFAEGYLREFPHIKVQKLDQGEGSTIFILTDTTTGEQTLFAVRSRVFPPGYGYS